jgi:cell division septal protein FtsQ
VAARKGRGTKPTARERRERREALRRRVARAVRVVLVLATLGAFAGGLGYYVFGTDQFRVQTVRVKGVRALSPDAVVLQSGVTQQDHLLLLRPEAIRQRVLALPEVRECRVERVLPGLLVLEVTEREAVATLLSDNRQYAVDREGVVVRVLGPFEPHPGPFITSVRGLDVIQVGDRVESRALDAALAVLDAFGKTAVASQVTLAELAARSENDIRMYCDELPYEIRWGRGEFDRAARRLDIYWAYSGGNLDCEEYCDLRFGMDIACR